MVTTPKMLYWNKRCLGPPKHLSFIKKNLFHDIFRRLWSCTGEESNFAVKFNLCGTPVNEVSRYNLAYVSFLLISLNLFVFINKNRKCSTADDLLKRVTNWGHFIPDCPSLCKVFINFTPLRRYYNSVPPKFNIIYPESNWPKSRENNKDVRSFLP